MKKCQIFAGFSFLNVKIYCLFWQQSNSLWVLNCCTDETVWRHSGIHENCSQHFLFFFVIFWHFIDKIMNPLTVRIPADKSIMKTIIGCSQPPAWSHPPSSCAACSFSHPSLPWLTWSSQALDLGGDLDVGLRGQGEAASLADAITQQGDVLLEAGGVAGEAQHGASSLGQRGGLVLGASREAAPQEVGDGGIAALLPALMKRREEEEEWNDAPC